MALWTTTAIISSLNTLNTFKSTGIVVESASANAVASLQLIGSPLIYNENSQASSIASGQLTESYTNVAQGGVVAPIAVVTGTSELTWLYGGVVAPLPIVDSTMTALNVAIGSCTIQLSGVVGTILNGSGAIGNVINPSPLVNGALGSSGNVQPALPIVAASGLTGTAAKGIITSKPIKVVGTLSQAAILVGDVSIPKPVVLGTLSIGASATGEVQNRISTVNAVGLSGSVSVGSVAIPKAEVKATCISEIILTGNISMPVPIVSSISPYVIASFNTWVLNAQNGRTSNYTQFPFIALGKMGVKPMGATADGIYLLEGDDDEGQAIESVFRFGLADFRSELSGVVDAYVGGDIEGELELGIVEDGQTTEYIYTVAERERHVRGHHTKLGKGFRARYRQLSISNTGGGGFKLNSLTLPSRDLKGNE